MTVPGYTILEYVHRSSAFGWGTYPAARAAEQATGREVWLELRPLPARWEELEAIALLDHPGIWRIWKAGRYERGFFLVRPPRPGEVLADRLLTERPCAAQAARWTAQAARAVQHAHDHGIFRAALSPHNLLLTPDGSAVLDGLLDATVLFLPLACQPDPGDVLALAPHHPSYLAPEGLRGEKAGIAPGVDLWGLGVLLHELLTGRPVFRGDNVIETILAILHEPVEPPSALAPGIPADLDAVCMRCLQKDPARRYASPEQLAEDLERFLAGQPLVHAVPPAAPLSRLGRWVRGWFGK